MPTAPKKTKDDRSRFIAGMDALAVQLVQAASRLPASMLTEKVDTFKACTAYANTVNKTPAQEEGNEIDEFRRQLGLGAEIAPRGGSAGSAAVDDGFDGDGDADAGDDADDNAPADFEPPAVAGSASAPPKPPADLSGARNGPVSQIAGSDFDRLRYSVGLPSDK